MLSTHIYGSVRMTVFIHVTNEDKQKNYDLSIFGTRY